jgi:hypothetical protein
MYRDGRIDQIALQRSQARQRAIFIRSRQPTVSDHVGCKYCYDFPCLVHFQEGQKIRAVSSRASDIVAGSTGRQEVARSGSAMSALGQKRTS